MTKSSLVLALVFCFGACAGGGSNETGSGGSGAGTGGSGGGSGGATGTGGSTGTGGATGTGGTTGTGGSTGTGGGGAGGASGGAGGSANGGAGGGLPAGSIIVQDNFDATAAGGRVDPAKWQAPAVGDTNAPAVDSAKFHSAPNSARVQGTSSGNGSFLVPVSGFPVPGNAFYVRAFMNWEKATSAITGHGGFIVGSVGRDNNGTEVRLGISDKGPGGVPRMELNVQMATDGGEVSRYSNGFTTGGNPASFTGTGYQFAANTWYCVEVFFNGSPTQSEFRVWVDGSEVQEMHVTNFQGSPGGVARNMWAPTYRFVKIGAQDYDSSLGRIWYDDVVVATSPVGCN